MFTLAFVQAEGESSNFFTEMIDSFEVTEDNYLYVVLIGLILFLLILSFLRNLSKRAKISNLQKKTKNLLLKIEQTEQLKIEEIHKLQSENESYKLKITELSDRLKITENDSSEKELLQREISNLQENSAKLKSDSDKKTQKIDELQDANLKLKSELSEQKSSVVELTKLVESKLDTSMKTKLDELSVNILKLVKLRNMHKDNILTDDEFNETKRKIISESF